MAANMLVRDLTRGTHPAVQWFKSAGLFLDPVGDDFRVPAAVLCDWVARYDDWYRTSVGVDRSQGLSLTYHREIAIVGEAPLALTDRLLQVATSCKQRGIGFSVTLQLERAVAQRGAVEQLIGSGLLSSVGYFAPEDEHSDQAAVRDLIEHSLRAGVLVGLIGPVAYFYNLGILDSPDYNAASTTIHPRTLAALAQPVHRSPVQACFSRFRVYIDEVGDLYPCLGLLGVDAARLGSVYQAFAQSVLGGAETVLDLPRLASAGPGLAGMDRAIASDTGLPWICERHRDRVIHGEPDPAVPPPGTGAQPVVVKLRLRKPLS